MSFLFLSGTTGDVSKARTKLPRGKQAEEAGERVGEEANAHIDEVVSPVPPSPSEIRFDNMCTLLRAAPARNNPRKGQELQRRKRPRLRQGRHREDRPDPSRDGAESGDER